MTGSPADDGRLDEGRADGGRLDVIGRRTLVLPGVLLLAWALLSVPHGLSGFDLLAGVFAAAIGLLAGVIWPALATGGRRALAATEDLLGDDDGGARGVGLTKAGMDGPAGDPDGVDVEAVPASLDAVLARLRESLAASRLIVWRVDRGADTVVAEHSTDPIQRNSPRSMQAAGNPLVWALEERSTLRVQPVPRWAEGLVVAAPVDANRVLTMESSLDDAVAGDRVSGDPASGDPAEQAALLLAAGILGPFLRLYDQQRDAVAANQRLDRVVEFLHFVPREDDAGATPSAVARAAMEIAGGEGALVASWDGEGGLVLVKEGTGGGPRPGTGFEMLEGDLSHAARTRSTVRREPGENRPALATGDERWERPMPPYRTVVPLVDPRGETTGLLAVWGSGRPAGQGIALLEAIAPLLALQLRQADDLESFRVRATIDPLTGLANRAALQDRMIDEASRFHRYRRPLALLVVDLDHFKGINDTHGHEAGDAILRGVAEAIRGVIRDVDFAARFGGEELVVLLPETMLRAAMEVAERVRAAVESSPMVFEGRTIPVTASIGLSGCPECVDEPDALFASADQALYVAKEAGRNRVVAASDSVAPGGADIVAPGAPGG